MKQTSGFPNERLSKVYNALFEDTPPTRPGEEPDYDVSLHDAVFGEDAEENGFRIAHEMKRRYMLTTPAVDVSGGKHIKIYLVSDIRIGGGQFVPSEKHLMTFFQREAAESFARDVRAGQLAIVDRFSGKSMGMTEDGEVKFDWYYFDESKDLVGFAVKISETCI